MILPTSVLHIRIAEDGRKKFNLWIPILPLWLLVIAVMIVLAPLAIIASLVLGKRGRLILAGPRLLTLFWAMRGLQVRVEDGKDQVLIIID